MPDGIGKPGGKRIKLRKLHLKRWIRARSALFLLKLIIITQPLDLNRWEP
jgi:hypothetical protein